MRQENMQSNIKITLCNDIHCLQFLAEFNEQIKEKELGYFSCCLEFLESFSVCCGNSSNLINFDVNVKVLGNCKSCRN